MIGISAQLAGNDRSWIGEFALSMSNQYRFGITLLGRFAGPSFDVFFSPPYLGNILMLKFLMLFLTFSQLKKGSFPCPVYEGDAYPSRVADLHG